MRDLSGRRYPVHDLHPDGPVNLLVIKINRLWSYHVNGRMVEVGTRRFDRHGCRNMTRQYQNLPTLHLPEYLRFARQGPLMVQFVDRFLNPSQMSRPEHFKVSVVVLRNSGAQNWSFILVLPKSRFLKSDLLQGFG